MRNLYQVLVKGRIYSLYLVSTNMQIDHTYVLAGGCLLGLPLILTLLSFVMESKWN